MIISALLFMTTTAFASEVCEIEKTSAAVTKGAAYLHTLEPNVIRCTDSKLLESLAKNNILVEYTYSSVWSSNVHTSYGIPARDGMLFLKKALLEEGYVQNGCGDQYNKN